MGRAMVTAQLRNDPGWRDQEAEERAETAQPKTRSTCAWPGLWAVGALVVMGHYANLHLHCQDDSYVSTVDDPDLQGPT